MISLVMADQLRTVVLNSINAFSRLWDAFDLASDPHAASAGCPLMKQDGSVEVSMQKRKEKKRKEKKRKEKKRKEKKRKEKKRTCLSECTIFNLQRSKGSLKVRYVRGSEGACEHHKKVVNAGQS